jgi:hypothetical protein
MSSTHDVISAFLDDEPFQAQELVHALSDPEGRALLIDLIALRHLVQPAEAAPPAVALRPAARRPWRALAAAAALVLALGGGYLAGGRRVVTVPPEAPPPTRVVEAVPFNPGGVR